MKLESWEPDLSSLWTRYQEGRLDLQPSFQRGMVWTREKQARLVDTVLRGWRVPPIHLVTEEEGGLSVLDGQQRLKALFEFLDNDYTVRVFSPEDSEISALAGMTFSQLPSRVQRQIRDTTITSYKLSDYSPDEPAELFFRLNLPTALTQAEKRNALMGATRSSIRQLVENLKRSGWNKELLGFTDSRLSYDDVIARAAVLTMRSTLSTQLSVKVMEDFYRSPVGLSHVVESTLDSASSKLTLALHSSDSRIRFNKATLLTWLMVSVRSVMDSQLHVSSQNMIDAINILESYRASGRKIYMPNLFDLPEIGNSALLSIYADRSSLRVGDVLSVQARDAVAWVTLAELDPNLLGSAKLQRQLNETRSIFPISDNNRFDEQLSEELFLSNVASWAPWSNLT